jgi:uncharacterized LabA/DUF88 family protein
MRAPAVLRAGVFVDGQNLFASARDAFGVMAPSFDVVALSRAVAIPRGWEVAAVHFYSGVPTERDNAPLHRAWARQLRGMRAQGVDVTVRPLRRHRRRTRLDDGTTAEFTVLEEKGIDVRIALDIMRAVIDRTCDVVLLFSQDQDFAELATEVRDIAREQRRWVKIASAFPVGEGTRNKRGVDRTDWIPIDQTTYEACLLRRGQAP